MGKTIADAENQMAANNQRDDNLYLESALRTKKITPCPQFSNMPTIFQNVIMTVWEYCGQYWKIVGKG